MACCYRHGDLSPTDNIQITPAVYWLSRPLGDDTRDSDGDYTSFGVLGGLIQTTFKF